MHPHRSYVTILWLLVHSGFYERLLNLNNPIFSTPERPPPNFPFFVEVAQLGGGETNIFAPFTPILVEDSQFDESFSDGLETSVLP